MQRSSIIATVIAAGGVLIAGSVASVAVINAASSSEVQATNLDLVADDAPASPAAVAPSASDSSLPSALPSVESSALPELPEVADAAEQPAAAPVQQAVKTSKSQKSDKPESEPSETAAPAAPTFSSDQARSIVMKQGDGVKTLAVSKETRQGYRTWAVRIERANGEVITGYVDRESGVVVDWTVNSQAPATTSTSGSTQEDDSQEAESEDHSGSDDSHESEDHESEGSDHESDDD